MSCGVTSGTPLSVLVTHALLNVHMQSNRLGRLYFVFSVMFFTVWNISRSVLWLQTDCSLQSHQASGCLKRLLGVLFSWLQFPAQYEDQLGHDFSMNRALSSKIKPKQTSRLILAPAIFGFLDTSSVLQCGQGDICIRVRPHLLPHLCPWPPPNVAWGIQSWCILVTFTPVYRAVYTQCNQSGRILVLGVTLRGVGGSNSLQVERVWRCKKGSKCGQQGEIRRHKGQLGGYEGRERRQLCPEGQEWPLRAYI